MELESISTSAPDLQPRIDSRRQRALSDHVEPDNYIKSGKSFFSYVHSNRGLIYMLITTIFMAVQAVFVSLLKDDLNSTELVSLEFGLMFCLTLPTAIAKGIPLTATLQELKYLLLRSLCGTVNMTSKYFAYQNMRVGDATAVLFGAPAVTGILGRIFLKEPFHILEGFTVLMTIGGVLIIAQPPFLFPSVASVTDSKNSLAGIIAAVGCMIMTATNVIIVRVMGKRDIEPFKAIFYYSVFASCAAGLFVPVTSEWVVPQCGMDRYLLIVMGVFGFLVQTLWTYALTLENAIYVSVLRTNEVVFVFLFEFLFLGVKPSLLSGLGTLLIVVASLLLSAKQIYQARESQKKHQSLSKEAPNDDDVPDEMM